MIVKTVTFPLEENLVVLNPSGDRVHLLDPMAKAVYQACTAGLLPEQMVDAITEGKNERRDTVRQDIDRLIESWYREGLMSGTHDASPVAPLFCPETEQPEKEQSTALETTSGTTALPSCSSCIYQADFRMHDIFFQIKSNDPALWKAVQALYSHLNTEPETEAAAIYSLYKDRGKYLLVQDGQVLTEADEQDEIVLALSAETAELWNRQRDWMMIAHAAALAKDGSCILLPARGGSGKTTLTAVLLRHGFTLLSDDIVPVLRQTGRTVAHPACLHIKQGSVDLLRPLYPELNDLHEYPWGSTTLRFLQPPNFTQDPFDMTREVTHMVFPAYERNAPFSLDPLSPTEAFRRLIESECMLGRPVLPHTIEELVRWIQERPAYTLRYGRLEDAVEGLQGLIEGKKMIPEKFDAKPGIVE